MFYQFGLADKRMVRSGMLSPNHRPRQGPFGFRSQACFVSIDQDRYSNYRYER
jgi:hypothetical protein